MRLTSYVVLAIIYLSSCSKNEELTPGKELVSTPPAEYNLHPFYKKYIDANGIPVISSEAVRDEALIIARDIVASMTSITEDVRWHYKKQGGSVVVIAANELTTDIPEYSDLSEAFPNTDWNIRARGLGATIQRPLSSVGEENLVCMPVDRYHGEDILTHELAHGLLNLGIKFADPEFDIELKSAYDNAKKSGLWDDTYAITNHEEYFAEGVQAWFDVNKEMIPGDGIHNHVNTRAELQNYDAVLYELISRYFPEERRNLRCQLLLN